MTEIGFNTSLLYKLKHLNLSMTKFLTASFGNTHFLSRIGNIKPEFFSAICGDFANFGDCRSYEFLQIT